MSHPVNDELLETCYEDAYNNFMVNNKLTNDQMQELILHEGVELAVGYSALTSSYNVSSISSFTGWLIRFTSDCLYYYNSMI